MLYSGNSEGGSINNLVKEFSLAQWQNMLEALVRFSSWSNIFGQD
jgi:hypothetical protein